MRLFAPVAVSTAVFALAAATSVSAQAPADQPAAQPAPAAEAKVADKKKDGVVCRRETPTGSMFPVKVCTTAEQRKTESASARKAQESMQSNTPVIPN